MGSCNCPMLTSAMKSFIFFAILMSLGLAQNQPRLSCPEEDTAFGDDDEIARLNGVLSWEECGEICTLDAGCNFWDWNPEEYCALKSSSSGLKRDEGWTAGNRDAPNVRNHVL